MTSAVNPSLEDIITGAIPGMPKVVAHSPVLAYENGAEFLQAWYDAEAGKLDPFVLIVEGSIPNEKINGEGHWAGMSVDPSSAIVATVNKHAGGRRVTHVTLRIGRLRQVVPQTLEFYMAIVGRDTPCEGATLEIIDVPAVLVCTTCRDEWEIEIPAFICGTCGPGAVEVKAGEEFMVESIEVEDEEEAACTAPR